MRLRAPCCTHIHDQAVGARQLESGELFDPSLPQPPSHLPWWAGVVTDTRADDLVRPTRYLWPDVIMVVLVRCQVFLLYLYIHMYMCLQVDEVKDNSNIQTAYLAYSLN